MHKKSNIIKREGEKVTELDMEFSKYLSALDAKGEHSMRGIFFNSTESIEYKREDGSMGTYKLVRIPFRSLERFTKVRSAVIEHCEAMTK
jgi:hypothetical protein